MSGDSITMASSFSQFRDIVSKDLASGAHGNHVVWYLDIKKFRFVNEAYGYSTGDAVLAEAQAFLEELLEGKGHFVRLNDDRFVLHTHHSGSEAATADFERFYRGFNRRLASMNTGHALEFAAGVYFLTPDDVAVPDISHVVDLAHTAHRRTKSEGGSSISLFDYEFFEKQQREMAIDSGLEDAIIAGEIEVWMQPQLDYLSGDIVGAEALARWNHATLGHLSPGEFIPVLERSGKIRELDRHVWETVCRAAHFWHEETGADLVPFSVNISRVEILDPGLPEYFLELQKKYQLPEKTLRLEVTESTYTDRPAELIEAVEALRGSGFIVEMDDFGSGYSSLNMLRNLPVDVLKLDMGFLQGEDEESNDAIILNCVIRMAHGLDIPIIAEGVETLEQAEMLKTMGCNLMQGYYFSRPLPINQFNDLLRESRARRQSFAWAQKLDHVRELLDMKGDTPFLFNHCIGGAVIFTFNGDLYETVLANDQFFDEVGYSEAPRELFSSTNLANYLTTASQETARAALLRAVEHGHARCELQTGKSGRWIDCTLHHIGTDTLGDTLIALVRDITSEHLLHLNLPSSDDEAEQVVARAARIRDKQTDMLTRSALTSLITGELGHEGGTLFLFDIDDFEALEDRMGAEIADEAIIRLTDILRSNFEKSALLARMSIDTFAAFVPNTTSQTQIRARACQIVDQIRQASLSHGKQFSCSIGIASSDKNDENSIMTLYQRAVRALYMVKFNGKDAFLLYEVAQMATLPGTDTLAISLRHSVDGELLPMRSIEGTDLFSVIGTAMEDEAPSTLDATEDAVRDRVFSAMRYHTMSHLPGILSFDYNPGDDTIFFETVDSHGARREKKVEGFRKHLFEFGSHIAEESMARLSSALQDLKYLPATGSLDLKCRLYDDSDYRWYRFSYTCLRDHEEIVIRGLGYGEDIDLARESTAWWKDRAIHDGLTGILNREGLEDAIANKLGKRDGGMMFIIDIDEFRDINDKLGHLSGDSVLCSVADSLLAMFRESDVLGRFGSDEFIAFISGFYSMELAAKRAQELLDIVNEIEVGQYGRISCSVGVAMDSARTTSFYQLLELADQAMHQSKTNGKGCYTIAGEGTTIHGVASSAESHRTRAGEDTMAAVASFTRPHDGEGD